MALQRVPSADSLALGKRPLCNLVTITIAILGAISYNKFSRLSDREVGLGRDWGERESISPTSSFVP